MLRLLTTIFLISASLFLYSYFRELNPGTITVHTGPSTQFELSAVTLVVFSMAHGKSGRIHTTLLHSMLKVFADRIEDLQPLAELLSE